MRQRPCPTIDLGHRGFWLFDPSLIQKYEIHWQINIFLYLNVDLEYSYLDLFHTPLLPIYRFLFLWNLSLDRDLDFPKSWKKLKSLTTMEINRIINLKFIVDLNVIYFVEKKKKNRANVIYDGSNLFCVITIDVATVICILP